MEQYSIRTIAQSYVHELTRTANLTQSSIAQHTGISQSSINRIKNGCTIKPRNQTFRKLIGFYCAVFFTDCLLNPVNKY
jgi:predicted transcriptional regulator